MVTKMNSYKMQVPRVSLVGRRARLVAVLASLGGVFVVVPRAEAQGRVVTISEVSIVGRVQKPIAAVDVSRIQPKLTLAELRQTFTDRIERALYRAPL
jgi:hypothetical protein